MIAATAAAAVDESRPGSSNGDGDIYHTLRRGNDELRIDTDLWLGVLELAAARGWAPRTSQRSAPPTQPSYARPSGLAVSAEEAGDLARSIDSGLLLVSDKMLPLGDHAFGVEHTEKLLSLRAQQQDVGEADVLGAREILSGEPKSDAGRLTAFMKLGAFSFDPE